MQEVPHKVFQIWISFGPCPAGVPAKVPQKYQKLADATKAAFEGAGWEYKLVRDADVPAILEMLPQHWRDAYHAAKCRPVVHVDLLRLFLLYEHGGLYLDMDIESPSTEVLKLLEFKVEDEIKFTDNEKTLQHLSNWLIYATKKSNKLKRFTDVACRRVHKFHGLLRCQFDYVFGPAVMYCTGPWAIVLAFSNNKFRADVAIHFKHKGASLWFSGFRKFPSRVLYVSALVFFASKILKKK